MPSSLSKMPKIGFETEIESESESEFESEFESESEAAPIPRVLLLFKPLIRQDIAEY